MSCVGQDALPHQGVQMLRVTGEGLVQGLLRLKVEGRVSRLAGTLEEGQP